MVETTRRKMSGNEITLYLKILDKSRSLICYFRNFRESNFRGSRFNDLSYKKLERVNYHVNLRQPITNLYLSLIFYKFGYICFISICFQLQLYGLHNHLTALTHEKLLTFINIAETLNTS